jgi:hypothetical protein
MVVTEIYVYQCLIEEAIGYWDETSPGYHYDPFEKQKSAGLESSVGSAEPMLSKIPALPKSSSDDIEIAASIAFYGATRWICHCGQPMLPMPTSISFHLF